MKYKRVIKIKYSNIYIYINKIKNNIINSIYN